MIENLISELQIKDKEFSTFTKNSFIEKYIKNEIILIQDEDTLSLYQDENWKIIKTKYSYVLTKKKEGKNEH